MNRKRRKVQQGAQSSSVESRDKNAPSNCKSKNGWRREKNAAAATNDAIVLIFEVTVNARSAADIRRYFFASGGKCANIFCTPLSRFLVFLSALLESVSLDEPRQIKFLALASNRSTTREP